MENVPVVCHTLRILFIMDRKHNSTPQNRILILRTLGQIIVAMLFFSLFLAPCGVGVALHTQYVYCMCLCVCEQDAYCFSDLCEHALI